MLIFVTMGSLPVFWFLVTMLCRVPGTESNILRKNRSFVPEILILKLCMSRSRLVFTSEAIMFNSRSNLPRNCPKQAQHLLREVGLLSELPPVCSVGAAHRS